MSRVITRPRRARRGSTPGGATDSVASTGSVAPAPRTSPSRLTVSNPGSVKARAYSPGRKSVIAYRPAPSVTTARRPSTTPPLVASTVTPGSTLPASSVTVPVIELCAAAEADASSTHANVNHLRMFLTSRIAPKRQTTTGGCVYG